MLGLFPNGVISSHLGKEGPLRSTKVLDLDRNINFSFYRLLEVVLKMRKTRGL